MPLLTLAAWTEVLKHCQADWPTEACGFVLATDGVAAQRVERVTNIAATCHQKNPARFPKGAEEAFIMDPRALGRIELMRRREGWRAVAVYHSHTRREGAHLSDDDVAGALLGGERPTYPDAVQLVVSLDGRGPTDAMAYGWDPAKQKFRRVSWATFSRKTGEVQWQDEARPLIGGPAPAHVCG